MATKGWITVHREITENWIWTDKEPFDKRSAWIDLLMMVNHEDKKIFFDGNLIEVKRGQRITSIRKLCDRWKWSNTKVKNFLENLEKDEMISLKIAPHKATLLTIVNYAKYQDINVSKSDTETSLKRQSSDTETSLKHLNNNDITMINNDNNDDDRASDISQLEKILTEINKLTQNKLSSSRLKKLIKNYGIEAINILVSELKRSTWLKERITWNISRDFLEKVISGDYRDHKATEIKKNKFANFEQITESYSEDELEEVARKKRQKARERMLGK